MHALKTSYCWYQRLYLCVTIKGAGGTDQTQQHTLHPQISTLPTGVSALCLPLSYFSFHLGQRAQTDPAWSGAHNCRSSSFFSAPQIWSLHFLVSPFGEQKYHQRHWTEYMRTNLTSLLLSHDTALGMCQRSTELSSMKEICYESSLSMIQVSGSLDGVAICVVRCGVVLMNVQSPS